MQTDLRPATADDIERVLAFWLDAAEPTSTDSAEALTNLLRYDPGALIVAEADGRIVGSVIAGWDGWRGAIYRLAVGPDAPNFADYIGLGGFYWAASAGTLPLLERDDSLRDWLDRGFNLYGGIAREPGIEPLFE